MFDEGSDGARLHYQLTRAKGEHAGMVAVSVEPFSMQVVDLSLARIEVPDFYIDHAEVTNREFKEFVDAGGYENPRFWVHEFRRAGKRLTFGQAVASFTDQAGRPGPAGWVLGNYADGAGDFPVGGVSWYEAAAYAEFRGKSLPTIFHWFAAAWPAQDPSFAFAASLIPQSNFSGALAAVGAFQGIGAQGAVDLVGNVREWSATPTGDSRYSLGGAFSDPTYFATQQTAQSPWDRLPENGLRCVSYLPGHLPDAKLLAPLDQQVPDFASVTPLTDERFATTKEFFSYDPSPLNATLERVETSSNWRLELVTLDTPYAGGRAAVRLYLPPDGRPPFEPVVFFPGIHALLTPAFEPWVPEEWSFIPRSGRAFVVPIVDGTWERGRGDTLERMANARSRTELLRHWVMDVGRTLDYLETRPDVDAKHAIFLGFSLGGSATPVALAFEDRFVGAISLSGGLSTPFGAQLARRVHVPLLMLNGRHDTLFPVQTRQQAMYDLWGAPGPLKRHVVYESGHVPPRGFYLRDMLDWLDRMQPTH
jgi:predicted esterase